jgi:hypothetical protein
LNYTSITCGVDGGLEIQGDEYIGFSATLVLLQLAKFSLI